jgi:hypothetical protein
MRVSTAERHKVADALSQHFAEGRLDTTEFNERAERAMAAKTRSDLSGLMTDLPSSDASLPEKVRSRRPSSRLFSLVVLAVLVSVAVWSVATPHLFWVFGAFVVWAIWHRHNRHYDGGGSTSLP